MNSGKHLDIHTDIRISIFLILLLHLIHFLLSLYLYTPINRSFFFSDRPTLSMLLLLINCLFDSIQTIVETESAISIERAIDKALKFFRSKQQNVS